jgi:hypothetical protein
MRCDSNAHLKIIMRVVTIRPTVLRLLACLMCATVGCANESGAYRLSEALDEESNRLSLLSEEFGAVEMAPSTESYWVALVPSNPSADLGPELPLTRQDYESMCSSRLPGTRILVGDNGGVGCFTTTVLDTDELRMVRKTPGEPVQIQLSHDETGVRVIAMN